MRKLGYIEALLIFVILGVILWMLFPSASEIRRLRGEAALNPSGHQEELVRDRGFILAQLKTNSPDGPDLAFAYLRRHQDEEMETLVSEYFGRLGDLDRQLLWLLRADEKQSDPKRREQIMRMYLQMGRVAEARQFLSNSIEVNQDMASLERLADLGDSRPLMANMNSRRETLNLDQRVRLFTLYFEMEDFLSAINSLSPRLEGLWIHPRIVDACLEILKKDPPQFQGIYPVLAHAYLYQADARILQAMQNNMDKVLPSDSIQWDTELALMYGDFGFIAQLLQKIADTGNKDNLLQIVERINMELSREPLSEGQKTVFPEVFTTETAPLLDWPLHLSPRFVRAGCEVKESFCFQSDRGLVIQMSDFEEHSNKLLESVDPEKKILRILSQDKSSVLTEELYLVWNRAGITGKSIPYLLELWERSDSTRLWSEILDGSLNLGDYATVWFLLRSQKNRELVSEWVFANESFQIEPAFSAWISLAMKDDAQDWLMPLASVYGSKRQWDQASKMWELVATRDSQHKNSRELLAHWNRHLSKLENASRYAKEAVDLGSTDPLLLLMVANDSGAKGNLSEASQYYTSACELFRPREVDELVLAFEACHKAKNFQKSALLVERLVLAEPENQYWVSVWHQELKSNQDWDSLLKIGSAMDLKTLSEKDLQFFTEIAPHFNDREFQNRLLSEAEGRIQKKPEPEAVETVCVIEEIREKESLKEIVLLETQDLALEIKEIEKETLAFIALKREKEITVRELHISHPLQDFRVGVEARQQLGQEELLYTVENYAWENFRGAYGHDSREFSIGKDIRFTYLESPLRGYLIGSQEDLRIKEVAIEFSKKIRQKLDAELRISRSSTQGRLGLVEKADRVEVGLRHSHKSGFFQEIRVIHRDQDEFFANRTALAFRDQDRLELLLGKRFSNRAGSFEVGAGLSVDGSKTSPILRTGFESVKGLGIYYESSWDPWLRKLISDYGVHWRQNF